MLEQSKSYHLVDTELREILKELPDLHLSDENVKDVRLEIEKFSSESNDSPADKSESNVTQTEVYIEGPDKDQQLRLLVFQPNSYEPNHPIYLDIHGGGRIIGTADTDNANNITLAQTLGCTVVSVDYRLAPETPHPGPLEDCYAALKWVNKHAKDYEADSNKIIIGGQSAGGGLAASLAILARDRGEVSIKFQDLQVPMLNDRTCVDPNRSPYLGEFLWTAELDYYGWKSYLGQEPGSEGISPYASASRLEDFSNLPPAYINIGSIELFATDCINYAQNLLKAGVPVELHVYPGVYHGGQILVPEAEISKRIETDHLEALKKAFKKL